MVSPFSTICSTPRVLTASSFTLPPVALYSAAATLVGTAAISASPVTRRFWRPPRFGQIESVVILCRTVVLGLPQIDQPDTRRSLQTGNFNADLFSRACPPDTGESEDDSEEDPSEEHPASSTAAIAAAARR